MARRKKRNLSSALPINADDEEMTQLTLGDLSERLGSKTGNWKWIYFFFLFPLNTNCKNQSAYITSGINQIVSNNSYNIQWGKIPEAKGR